MIRIIATLCQLAHPDICREQLVTSDQFQPIGMSDCINMAALADWMKAYPAYRLAGWKCTVGSRGENT